MLLTLGMTALGGVLDLREHWTIINGMQFNKGKRRLLYLARSDAGQLGSWAAGEPLRNSTRRPHRTAALPAPTAPLLAPPASLQRSVPGLPPAREIRSARSWRRLRHNTLRCKSTPESTDAATR